MREGGKGKSRRARGGPGQVRGHRGSEQKGAAAARATALAHAKWNERIAREDTGAARGRGPGLARIGQASAPRGRAAPRAAATDSTLLREGARPPRVEALAPLCMKNHARRGAASVLSGLGDCRMIGISMRESTGAAIRAAVPAYPTI